MAARAQCCRDKAGLVSDSMTKLPPEPATDDAQRFRSQVGHISRNSAVYFAGTIFSVGLGYLFKVYLARVLGAEDLGLYALGMTMVGFFGIFNTLGLPNSALRFVAEYSAAEKMKELHALLWRGAGFLLAANLVLAGVLLFSGHWIATRFYHAPRLTRYLPLFALIMMFGVLNGFYGKVLAGYRDLKLRTLIVNFIGSPLNMSLSVILIWAGLHLRGYLLAQVASAAAVGILLLVAVRHFTPRGARFFARRGSAPEKEVMSFSAAMLGISLLEFLISQTDKVTLGFYRSARDVGIYSVAAALVVYIPLALSSVNQILAPMIADLYTRGEHTLLRRLFQSLTKWVVGLTLPLAFVVVVFARPLMRIFGPEFEVGWPVLIIGTVGQLINCGVGSVGYLLLMSGNEKRLLKVQISMAILAVLGCASLTPIWGIYGTATAMAVTNIGMNGWNLLEVRKALRIIPYNRSYLHLALPAAVTAGVILVVKNYSPIFHHEWLSVGVALVFGYCVFPAVFWMTSGLDEDDRLIASALRARLRSPFRSAGAES